MLAADESASSHRLRKTVTIIVLWGAAAVLFTTQNYYYRLTTGAYFPWLTLLRSMGFYAATWALFTPIVLILSRRFRVQRNQWASRILLHLLFAIIIAAIHRVCYQIAGGLIFSPEQPIDLQNIINAVIGYFDYGVYIYFIIMFIDHAVVYYQQYNEERLRAVQLRADLASAQLQSLQMQLQPHFLFNTLNAISVLIGEDPDAATIMVKKLSELLRLSLEQAESHLVPLRDELEFLDHYLLIEQIRFGDRLTIKKHVDPRALDAVVPYLLLQPIVENALHHGIGTIPGPGTVEISADRPNGLVVLSVADNGPGLVNTVSPDNHLGVGLSNIRARLSQLYGEKHTFVLENISGGGVKVTVTIPSVDAE